MVMRCVRAVVHASMLQLQVIGMDALPPLRACPGCGARSFGKAVVDVAIFTSAADFAWRCL
jgi:hypothetical protein